MRQNSIRRLVHYSLIALLFLIPMFITWSVRYQPDGVITAWAQGESPLAQRAVQFTSSTYSVTESGGPAVIQVSTTITDTTIVTVQYFTLAGTATAGSSGDYITASGTLTFTQAAQTQSFNVVIVNNSTYEQSETVNLVLTNPTNAVLGTRSTAVLTITDDDPIPGTSTPIGGTATPIFVDFYEPNDTLGTAYTIAASANASCNSTLWPIGDVDFFRFVAKAGSAYEIATDITTAGLDTDLTVYDTQGNIIGHNDDNGDLGDRSSLVEITTSVNGFYYAQVINRDPSNPANKTYCIQVTEILPPTPTPSQTPVQDADICEFNSTLEYACILEVGEANIKRNMSFVPVYGSLQDTDVYKVWMRQGTFYTCDTFVNDYADTNMIFLDRNGGDFQPNLGNNDKAVGDYGSKLSLLAPYTGWLYIVVGPIVAPPYEESFLHKYDIQCLATLTTPTPTPTLTATPGVVVTVPGSGGGGGGGTAVPTPTPFIFPTFPPSPTPIDFSILTPPSTATPPVIQIQPLPTATPFGGGQQSVAINVTVYYDANFNYLPELNEGVRDIAVALYDNANGSLLAYGLTNPAGTVNFNSLTAVGAVRVYVPFLNYNQVVVGGGSTILVRIAPQPLPIGIP